MSAIPSMPSMPSMPAIGPWLASGLSGEAPWPGAAALGPAAGVAASPVIPGIDPSVIPGIDPSVIPGIDPSVIPGMGVGSATETVGDTAIAGDQRAAGNCAAEDPAVTLATATDIGATIVTALEAKVINARRTRA